MRGRNCFYCFVDYIYSFLFFSSIKNKRSDKSSGSSHLLPSINKSILHYYCSKSSLEQFSNMQLKNYNKRAAFQGSNDMARQ